MGANSMGAGMGQKPAATTNSFGLAPPPAAKPANNNVSFF
jgi:hypothetical protein